MVATSVKQCYMGTKTDIVVQDCPKSKFQYACINSTQAGPDIHIKGCIDLKTVKELFPGVVGDSCKNIKGHTVCVCYTDKCNGDSTDVMVNSTEKPTRTTIKETTSASIPSFSRPIFFMIILVLPIYFWLG